MSIQDELDFHSRTGPTVTKAEIDAFCTYLYGRGWVKSAQIAVDMCTDERRIRAVAEASNGLIISGPGCPGYKLLTGAAELRDVDEAANRLESQAKRMLLRAHSLRRRAHALIR